MSVDKLFSLATILSAFVCTLAYADCVRDESVPTIDLDMHIGRVIVQPNAPVGSVLAYREWSLSRSATMYNCTGPNLFASKVIGHDMQELSDHVYSTNVPGIGLRFKRRTETGYVLTYPGVRMVTNQRYSYPVFLEATTFILEVIKTEPITGSGRVASGPYTSYGYIGSDNPQLTTSLSADALTIVSPSCLVSGGNNQSVDIGTIHRNQLSGKGSFAGGRNFELKLKCSGGVSLSGFADIKMTFDGTLATGTAVADGVLINENTGSQSAQGVGVQVLNEDQSPLEMGKPQLIGTLNDNEIHYITLKYFARFYQYLDSISTGEVRSHLIFNIDYE
ncbi:fimbrial protein [Serratia oryzae]|uniref:Fimbrial protein n=1 Tax=Serratia oryzae TaxID=2034155 RepID=A0A1S8CKS5_9GAMM|nr:fimbrial protein [Serratia oryzae]OMQ23803.1 fimbrial protein [Serratia oryzae]